jgi:hypothetical protein
MSKSLYDSSAWNKRARKLAILIPTRDTLHSLFALSLSNMVKTNTQLGIDTHVIMDGSTILPNQRTNLAKAALEINADYSLWLDSDMVFPSTTAARLLNHDKHIVAANYMKRGNPLTTVAYEKVGDWDSWLPLESSEKLVKVEGIGMGCVLMRTSIFEEMEKPWFEFTYNETSQDFTGEDFFMFNKSKNLGYDTWVDMNLSRQIRHLGIWAFGPTIHSNQEKINEKGSLFLRGTE